MHIRRTHHLFPIRPYLSLLVECLEDTDPHVRDCARQSIIELFSGPGVTDAARADLKKELIKKGVRKTIVDGVLSKLLGGTSSGSNSQSREGSENGEASTSKQEYVPPSLALQGKRPRVASQSSAGIPRTASQSSTKEIPRPISRADLVSPQPSQPQTPVTESLEIRPVYVRYLSILLNLIFKQTIRSHQAEIWKMNSHLWPNLSKLLISYPLICISLTRS